MKPFSRLAQFISWHRRLVAAALVAVGVVALGNTLAAPPPKEAAFVVVKHEIIPGSPIKESDVEVTMLPAQAVPVDAITTVADVVGQQVVSTLPAGTIVQAALLIGRRELPEGRALVPIVIRDESIRDLLTPGTPITLVMADQEGAQTITDDATVATAPGAPSGGGPLGPPQSSSTLMVEVPVDAAGTVAALGQQGSLSVVLAR